MKTLEGRFSRYRANDGKLQIGNVVFFRDAVTRDEAHARGAERTRQAFEIIDPAGGSGRKKLLVIAARFTAIVELVNLVENL